MFLSFIARSFAQWLNRAMQITSRILDCPESEAHIIRRLGKAVVVQWDNLPEPVQALLLKQAVLMHDQVRAIQLRQKIKSFIQRWKIVE